MCVKSINVNVSYASCRNGSAPDIRVKTKTMVTDATSLLDIPEINRRARRENDNSLPARSQYSQVFYNASLYAF